MNLDRRFPVNPGEDADWIRLGFSIRITDRAMRTLGRPTPTSELAVTDAQFPPRPLSQTIRHCLEAAGDHLLQWSDLVTPLQVFEGQAAIVNPRTVYSYARSAMESAGAATWILEELDPHGRLLRHLQLAYHDLREQRAAYLQGGWTELADSVDARMKTLLAGPFEGREPAAVRYLDRVRAGARASFQDPDQCEYYWRVASAASHGQEWFYSEAFQAIAPTDTGLVPPDGQRLIEILDASYRIFQAGVLRFIEVSGGDPVQAQHAAIDWHTSQMPLKDESHRSKLPTAAELARLIHDD